MQKCLVIAEAGVNHNGSEALAYKLINAAHAGADIVKFQTFKSEFVVSQKAEKAKYQKTQTGGGKQLDMIRKLELNFEVHKRLCHYCEDIGIEYMSTAFDQPSLDLLAGELKLGRLKIASGEILNGPLLLAHAKKATQLIVSTGMCTMGDIEQALGVIAFGLTGCKLEPCEQNFHEAYCSEEGQKLLREKVTLLHCTTEYPSPFNEVNLNVLNTFKSAFDLPVGYSDHTKGIAIPTAAVALGAKIIEKHFTLDSSMEGPDHKASLEPAEFKKMISQIREVEMSLGSSVKKPTPSESANRAIARKSLMAGCDIKAGEIFDANNMVAKRPGTGISPMQYWSLVGTVASKNYQADDQI
jgi:N-acetylneuraminate synthase